MNKETSREELIQEYRLLLESPKSAPPSELSAFLKKQVATELNPTAQAVFLKLFAIHFISGAITLLVCPQFGIVLTERSHALLSLFLGFGEYGCMLVCGAVFLGGTGLVAALLLKAQEVRAIRRSKGLQWALLAFLSVGFFLAFREQERAIPIGMAVTWLLGALLGGVSVFGLSYELRRRLRQRPAPKLF